MRWFIVKLLYWLGWLSGIAFGQTELSETVSGSASFPDLGITCLGNLAVFFSSFLRGRLHLEIGVKDVLATLTGVTKLRNIEAYGWEDINCFGLTTSEEGRTPSGCYVLMLSLETPNSSMRQFVEYIANVYNVRSILLQYFPLKSLPLTLQICNCLPENVDRCSCIVFWGPENFITMLVGRMPGTIKRLSGPMYLLPCAKCLQRGCHGCNGGLLYLVEGSGALRKGDPVVGSPPAVCKALEIFSCELICDCICIPLFPTKYSRSNDEWTKLLIRSFKSKDNEARGAMNTDLTFHQSSVSDALENYIAGSGETYAGEEYGSASVIVPRLAEIVINLALTFWFKLDGFSSALVARRAIRYYIVDESGKGLAAHVFITRARVVSNDNYTHACQLLSFRGNLLSAGTLSLIVASVNLICSLSWAVLIALEGGANRWYHTHSVAPSKLRVYAIILGIVIALGMDFVDLKLYSSILRISPSFYSHYNSQHKKNIVMMCGVITLEIVCVFSGIALVQVWGMKHCARWVYSVMHVLVWIKWGMASYLLDGCLPRNSELCVERLMLRRFGSYMYSSAFFLNAVLAGVRTKWEYK